MAKYRVLQVLGQLGSGGAESFIMSIYRAIDKENIQFDFLTRSKNNDLLVQEVEKMGGRVYSMPEFPRECIKNYKYLDEFLKKHKEYEVIHVHANSYIYIFPAILGKRAGVKNIILHSHNSRAESKFFNPLHYLNRALFLDDCITARIACSDLAGVWMFGNRSFKKINNAIDTDKFLYNHDVRDQMREKLNIKDKIVIGHIGKFTKQKNHEFIIEVFTRFYAKNPNAVLLLIGDGKLKRNIEEKCMNLGVRDAVVFVGITMNVNAYIQAMDIFLFPSFYEGLPIAVVEAQASGVMCIISKNITAEVCLTKNVIQLSLEKLADKWAEVIENNLIYDRDIEIKSIFASAGFDIKKEASKLEKFYEDSINK